MVSHWGARHRYLELSRVVTGEVMASVFAEWRRPDSGCGGALTWFLNDLRPGAGWGLIDSDGHPKAVLRCLTGAWAPRCVRLLDRGLDGLVAHCINEAAESLDAEVELLLIGASGGILAEAREPICLGDRSSADVSVEGSFGHFLDSTYSYRFGPPRHQAVVARLLAADGTTVVSEDVFRRARWAASSAAGLDARVAEAPDGSLAVTLSSNTIVYDVRVEVRDHYAVEDHFCMTPGRPRTVLLRPTTESPRSFRGYVEGANLTESLRLARP